MAAHREAIGAAMAKNFKLGDGPRLGGMVLQSSHQVGQAVATGVQTNDSKAAGLQFIGQFDQAVVLEGHHGDGPALPRQSRRPMGRLCKQPHRNRGGEERAGRQPGPGSTV